MLFWGTEQEGVREEFMGALQRAEAYKPDIKTKYAIASLRKRLFLPMPPHISSRVLSCHMVEAVCVVCRRALSYYQTLMLF